MSGGRSDGESVRKRCQGGSIRFLPGFLFGFLSAVVLLKEWQSSEETRQDWDAGSILNAHMYAADCWEHAGFSEGERWQSEPVWIGLLTCPLRLKRSCLLQ